jgi:hypothetical protein
LGSPVPLPICKDFRSTPRSVYVSRRNGMQTSGRKSAETTTLHTPSATPSLDHGHGTLNLQTAYPVSLNNLTPYALD